MKDVDAKDLEMKTKAMQLYIYEALDVARKSAANAIDSYASGVEKFAMRRLVDGLLRAYEINPKDMRRALADYAVEKMDYPF